MSDRQQERPPVRIRDLVLASVLYAVAVLFGAVTTYATLFFALGVPSSCDGGCAGKEILLASAMYVSWGGTVLALAGALVMIVVSAVRRRPSWRWPLLAMGVIVGAFLVGLLLASMVIEA